MLQVHGSIHHEGKNSTRGVEKAVSNSAQYREWLSYLVSGMARAVTMMLYGGLIGRSLEYGYCDVECGYVIGRKF
jgi:hypothetical protein